MYVRKLLGQKGATVFKVTPEATLREAAALMADHGIGALLVSSDGNRADGIISERDIVRAIADKGADCMTKTVQDLMTVELVLCSPDDTIDSLMAEMTEQRVRHIPVVVDENVIGIVSIGDVVKNRIAEVEHEANMLREFIRQ